jgi:glycosyltransferase involved in cell wall biosynthesis
MVTQKFRKISVIIPTYNRSSLIVDTIESFLGQDYQDFEVIVCNNNSTDNTQEVLKTYLSNSKVRLLLEQRPGVHFARNTAAKFASGDLLYFTDDDMIATPNLLSEIVKIFDLDESIASATGRVLPKWEIEPPKWVEKLLFNARLSLHNPAEEIVISSEDFGVYSCHQAILREAFFKAGGFNPDYIAGVLIGDGETGLNLKIKELGYKFGYIGSSIIYHRIPPSKMTQKYLNTRLQNEGNCHAYTTLRMCNGTIDFPKEILKELVFFWYKSKVNLKNSKSDINYLRFFPADLKYLLAKLSYYMKARRDSEFMEMVLRQNWIED